MNTPANQHANATYWKKITLEAIEIAFMARKDSDTETYLYDWMDELDLRIKEVHKSNVDQLELKNVDEKDIL